MSKSQTILPSEKWLKSAISLYGKGTLYVPVTANMVSKLFPLIGSMMIGYNHGITIGIIWFVGLWILIRKFMYKCSLEPSILAKIARIEGFSVPLTTRDKIDVLLAHFKRICVKYEVDMNI